MFGNICNKAIGSKLSIFITTSTARNNNTARRHFTITQKLLRSKLYNFQRQPKYYRFRKYNNMSAQVQQQQQQQQQQQPQKLNIVVVCWKDGDRGFKVPDNLPEHASIIATGDDVNAIVASGCDLSSANVILNISGNKTTLPDIVTRMPNLRWIHSCFAGVDAMLFPALVANDAITVTNAKGVYSYDLAEYVMAVCLQSAKNFKRLEENQAMKAYDVFPMQVLRGKTMGIIGYGDIGRTCAQLAKSFHMRTLGARRRVEESAGDPHIDQVFSLDGMLDMVAQSDYLVACLPLVPDTVKMINTAVFAKAKSNCIFINIGRGAKLDDDALMHALISKQIKGAALDVFTVEPLPASSKLWTTPNLIISPHNADITEDSTGRIDSVQHIFVVNVNRMLGGRPLMNVVNKNLGY